METSTIPKIELHCHLIGVINSALMSRLESAGCPTLVPSRNIHPPSDVSGEVGFRQWLESVGAYRFASWTDYKSILRLHVENLKAQNVKYAEIMISPRMFGMDIEGALLELSSFLDYTRSISLPNVQIRYIFVIPRSLPEEKMKRDTELFSAARHANLALGVAIVGIEYGLELNRLFPMLRTLKNIGMGIEVHSGEHTGPDEVRQVLNSGLADRIGHGIAAFREKELVKKIVRTGVHLEFCPTSNLRTGVIAKFSDLPIRAALDSGISFSINTDDPGAFGCTLVGEYDNLVGAFGLGAAEFRTIYEQSAKAAFDEVS